MSVMRYARGLSYTIRVMMAHLRLKFKMFQDLSDPGEDAVAHPLELRQIYETMRPHQASHLVHTDRPHPMPYFRRQQEEESDDEDCDVVADEKQIYIYVS